MKGDDCMYFCFCCLRQKRNRYIIEQVLSFVRFSEETTKNRLRINKSNIIDQYVSELFFIDLDTIGLNENEFDDLYTPQYIYQNKHNDQFALLYEKLAEYCNKQQIKQFQFGRRYDLNRYLFGLDYDLPQNIRNRKGTLKQWEDHYINNLKYIFKTEFSDWEWYLRLFYLRFEQQLIDQNFNGKVFQTILNIHNIKWNNDNEPFDQYKTAVKFNSVFFGGDYRGNYSFSKTPIVSRMQTLKPFAHGYFTTLNMQEIMKCTDESNSLVVQLRKTITYYNKKRENIKSKGFQRLLDVLKLKDYATTSARGLTKLHCCDKPTDEEFSKNRILVDKYGWSKD